MTLAARTPTRPQVVIPSKDVWSTSAVLQCDDGLASVVAHEQQPDAPVRAAPPSRRHSLAAITSFRAGQGRSRGDWSAEPSICGGNRPPLAACHAAPPAIRAAARDPATGRAAELPGHRSRRRREYAWCPAGRADGTAMSRRKAVRPVDQAAMRSRSDRVKLSPGCPLRKAGPRDRRRFGLRPICQKQQLKERVLETVADVGGPLANVIATVRFCQAE